MTIEEARFELSRLAARQEQLEREILAILNKGCLPLEKARKKMKAGGIMTEISQGGMERVVFTTPDGEKGFTDFPVWYPRYAGMDDIFESLEMDMAVVKDLKKRRAENKLAGIRNEDGDGYISAYEKVFEKAGEYRANEAKIEELSKALETSGQFPEYIKYLIESCYLYPDGRRVIKSLDDTVCALVDYLNSDNENDFLEKKTVVDWKFVRRTFLQENGELYSEIACRKAIEFAYANSGRKPRGPKREPRKPNPLSRRL